MPDTPPVSPERQPPLPAAHFKKALDASRLALRRAFETNPAAPDLLRKHCALADQLLRDIWQAHEIPAGLALMAVGGYGRGQLFPHSDIDLLILLDAPADEALQEKLQALISTWWDIGLDTGHSVRTVDECVAMARQDITAQTNMLESRLLAGNRKRYQQFVSATADVLEPMAFIQAKRLEQQQRHVRFGETNLEPNVKESAGGLRDLHHIIWISRATGFGKSWADLVRRGLVTDAESREIQRHERFLHLLRIRLHYLAGRREDRLIFDLQSALAEAFGLANRAYRLASEQLMQRYYQSAKAVSQIDNIVLQNIRARLSGVRTIKLQPLNERFGLRNEVLSMRHDDTFEKHPEAILETFLLLQQHSELKGIGANTQRALWRARKSIGPAYRRNPVHHEQFLNILRGSDHVVRELRRMNQLGILGSYLPAFGKIAGQMQHDLYHVYTVDEHILRVIRNLRRFAVPELAHEFPLCSRLMSEFDKPEVLYLAGLFHDIAKGRGGDHSTLGKADAAKFCKEHGLSADDCTLVVWLVEQHLMMSSTAQKQDLSDPDVIRAFVAKVVTERRLIALYLVTVADIRGTSPKVWNAWKGKLLEDLFLVTQRQLSGSVPTVELTVEHSQRARQDEARKTLRLYAIPDEAIDKFWMKLDTAYFLRHDAQEIAWHTRTLYYRAQPPAPVIKARPSRAGEGLQVMVYVQDQEELFARICGFFESIRYNIHEARIYTAQYGYALDTFQVQDAGNADIDYRDLTAYIEHELGERLRLKSPLPPLTKPRLSRQLRHFPISPEVSIQKDDRGVYQVLSIVAGDRPGLLSRIARVFLAYGIDLHTAKINTLGSRAEDTFLITGDALADPKQVVRMESDLIETLKI